MAHTLRKVDKDFSFDEQRVELNELALDVYNLQHHFDDLSLDDLVDVNAAGAAIQQIIKFNGTKWVLDTDIVSTSFSVQTNAASGGGALSYDNSTAIFQYTPPDLSGFLTSLGSVGGHTDVTITSPQNDHVLKWNGTAWVNAPENQTIVNSFVGLNDTPSTFTANKWIKVNSGGTALEWTDAPQATVSSVNDIGDVTITNAQNDQLLKWDGSNWVNFTPGYLTSFTEQDPTVPSHVKNITQANINTWNSKSDVSALNDLSDVDTTGVANNKILKHNGTNWVVADDATGGGASGANVTISDTAPASPTAGDLWFKSDEGRLKIYYNDGSSSQWVDTSIIGTGGGGGGATVTTDDNAPSNPSDGDLWWKSNEGQLKVYYQDADSSQWVDTGGGFVGITLIALKDVVAASTDFADFKTRVAAL